MELLAWIEQTDFSTWLRESDWGYPNLLCVHAVGMGMVVGISFMYSARILGYAKAFPLAAFDKLFGLAWFGFVMNAASGILLFVGEPRRLALTPAFWIKMILIVFAGFSLWALAKALDGATDVHAIDGLPGPDGALAGESVVATNAKVAAVVSVVFWLAAITAGRLIGYTMPPPPL
jgi:hypothetical protein